MFNFLDYLFCYLTLLYLWTSGQTSGPVTCHLYWYIRIQDYFCLWKSLGLWRDALVSSSLQGSFVVFTPQDLTTICSDNFPQQPSVVRRHNQTWFISCRMENWKWWQCDKQSWLSLSNEKSVIVFRNQKKKTFCYSWMYICSVWLCVSTSLDFFFFFYDRSIFKPLNVEPSLC